jgi:pyruvyl transferase EpsI
MNIKKYIPLKFKQTIQSHFASPNIHGDLSSKKHKIFIALAADYGNLGDVAISYAQYFFLQKNFPNSEIIDVPISQTLRNIREIKKYIRDDDVITIVGGGNLTNKYQDIEDYRLSWVNSFPKNKIISFPQTIDFSKNKDGDKSLAKSFHNYNNHDSFYMFARESISHEKMMAQLTSAALFCPDIVLSLDKSNPSFERKGITCCIREDEESNLSIDQRTELINNIKDNYGDNVTFTDTHIGVSNLSWQQRQDELNKIWDKFKGSQLVITDRLHGMIFSVITKTPCLVLINNNHKILQTYKDWLVHLPHISLVEEYNLQNVMAVLSSLLDISSNDLTLPNLSDEYQSLTQAISNET